MSDFSKLIGLDKLTGVFSKVKNAVDEAEHDAESLIADGTAAAASITAALATPSNIPNDIEAVTASFNDLVNGFNTLKAIYGLAKGAVATAATATKSVSVVTHTPVTVTHPASGTTTTLPAGSTISVPVPAAPESAAPSTFPATGVGSVEETPVTSVNADNFESPVSPDLAGEVGGNP